MKFRQTLAPIAVLATLTLGTAAPARAAAPQARHRERHPTADQQSSARAKARARTRHDERARPEPRRDRGDRHVNRRDRDDRRFERHDRDDRRFGRRDRDDRRFERRDRDDRYRPFVRIVPPAVVVNRYRAWPWWSGSRRFSFGLYIGTVAPFRWAAPPPVFAGAPYASYGAVTFDLDPDDALVYVDGYYVGRVEDFRYTRRPLTLVAGRHDVLVRAPGYAPMRFRVDVYAGRLVPYRGDLVRGW